MACERPGQSATTGSPSGSTPVGVVTSVHDGDSIEVTLEDGSILEVRLHGVNAPTNGECHYEESRAYLIDVLEERDVRLVTGGTDQFERVLAHVFAGELHVNERLVADGHAIATTPAQGDPDAVGLLTAESTAADQGLGLWSSHACGAGGAVPDVTIEGIEANPPGPDQDRLAEEYVVIANEGTTPVDLSGWVLRDESSRHRYRFAPGLILSPGERLVITSADPAWEPGASPVLNNDGDMAMLLDGRGRVVSAIRY